LSYSSGVENLYRQLLAQCTESRLQLIKPRAVPQSSKRSTSDLSAFPLCQRHHRTGDDSIHKLGQAVFQDVHVRIAEIIRRLTAKPKIMIKDGCFVAELNQQTYLLGGTGLGLESALRRLRRIRYQEVVA
jgi:hypothetical protein